MGDFKIQGMLIGILVIGAFMSLVIFAIELIGPAYDTTGYSANDLSAFTVQDNISAEIARAQSSIEDVTIDKNLFDYLAGIFNVVITPFKVLYQSFGVLVTIVEVAGSELFLWSPIIDFMVTFIIVLVIVGLVLIKYYMGKDK